jgi:aryl-alcohol dehydrogenase-like predicted oxidoreductase
LDACKGSLRRLGTDYIDLYQIHWPDRYVASFGKISYDKTKERPAIPFEEQVNAMGELLRAGKIRYWGVSNETAYGVTMLCLTCDTLGVPRPITIQNSYSLLHRQFEGDTWEACSHFGIELLPWSPLAGGFLTGKYIEPSGGESNARFKKYENFQTRFRTERCTEATREYARIAKEHGISLVELALGFVHSRQFVGSIIIGGSQVKHIKNNVEAHQTKLVRTL